MREALNGRPPADRTRHDYQRVINAYRSVYFGAPTSTKADPSVVAVAETLVEMGRRFNDDKILNEAIAQYKFLRKEYPGSKYRCDALFTMGEIYSDDLNDPEQARATFKEFLRRYPHNRLVEDAQRAILDIDRQAEARNAETEKKAGKETAEKANSLSAKASAKDEDASADDASQEADGQPASRAPGRLPRVTGIRHWSTPDYTRVAIDLEGDVTFASQRISNPDRIFFDLRDTKLASTLVGKSFDVDDGFLKKIRVAQFQPGRTRVVLEVEDLSDYEAFLLPNPYRLIIDIHGKDMDSKNDKPARRKLASDAMMNADVEAAPKAGSNAENPKTENPKADVANADVTKRVPKSELKADVKALTGEPVSKTEQIHDQPRSEDEGDAAEAKSNETTERTGTQRSGSQKAGPRKAKTREVEVKTATGTIKKVIVYPDDEDDAGTAADTATEPKELAKVDAPLPSSASAAHKSDTSEDSNDPDTGNGAANENPGSTRVNGKHVHGKAEIGTKPKSLGLDAREAKPTASGDRSLIRALGLKIGKIVIDPGHGGHDTGTIGPNGLEEKDLVLDVGRRLGKLLEARLGAEVVYTRKDDTFIPLETRTAIANQQRADLFISIHANSSRDPDARGVETYYLNFTSSPDALEVAARENAVSEKSIYELQDLVKKIALKEKIEESREFAADVQESLHSGLAAKSPAIRDRGVKKAPFIVLIGANMPSILAEISFVSNPTDERRLETSEYRQRIAESLYRGIAKYADGLSGVRVASKMDKPTGQ
jgi:N-acetylmuramoyl-L-alanine amidase